MKPRVPADVRAGAGLERVAREGRTPNLAETAALWYAAHERRAADQRRIEGEESCEGQQHCFAVAARLAGQ